MIFAFQWGYGKNNKEHFPLVSCGSTALNRGVRLCTVFELQNCVENALNLAVLAHFRAVFKRLICRTPKFSMAPASFWLRRLSTLAELLPCG